MPHDHHAHAGHDDHHDHRHDAHGHAHAPADFGRAFFVGITLNLAFVGTEAVYGWLASSMALIADAGHNLSDVLGLALAWVATILARRKPTATHTYGLGRSTILAALGNAMLLLVAVGAIAVEAVRRLAEPAPVATTTVVIVAGIGIVINTATALLFMRGRTHDINVRGAFLHMVYDALVSVGVVVAGLLIAVTGWLWVDPLISLVIAAVILVGAWGLLRDSVGMSLDAVPKGMKLEEVRRFLLQQPGVSEVHDLHIWSMSTTDRALTCHCVMLDGHPGDAFLVATATALKETFGIHHVTLQIEVHAHVACALEPEHVV